MAAWEADRRLDFIDYMLVVHGNINRADLMLKFGVSEPQASIDIRKFAARHPLAITYNRSDKMYVSANGRETVRGNTSDIIRLHNRLYHLSSPLSYRIPRGKRP